MLFLTCKQVYFEREKWNYFKMGLQAKKKR